MYTFDEIYLWGFTTLAHFFYNFSFNIFSRWTFLYLYFVYSYLTFLFFRSLENFSFRLEGSLDGGFYAFVGWKCCDIAFAWNVLLIVCSIWDCVWFKIKTWLLLTSLHSLLPPTYLSIKCLCCVAYYFVDSCLFICLLFGFPNNFMVFIEIWWHKFNFNQLIILSITKHQYINKLPSHF